MDKIASLSGRELVAAKEAKSKKILDSSLAGSISRKAGLAAAAYYAGSKVGGDKGGKIGAAATLIYSVPKIIHEELQKNKARNFLSMTNGEKLYEVKKEDDKKRLGKGDLLVAYVGKRVFDNVVGPESVNIANKEKAKKKFNIEDAL